MRRVFPLRLSQPAEFVLKPITIGDILGLRLLERGKKFACGCGYLTLSEMFEIGNDRAQLNNLPRTGPDDVLRRRQLLQKARCLLDRTHLRSSGAKLPANEIRPLPQLAMLHYEVVRGVRESVRASAQVIFHRQRFICLSRWPLARPKPRKPSLCHLERSAMLLRVLAAPVPVPELRRHLTYCLHRLPVHFPKEAARARRHLGFPPRPLPSQPASHQLRRDKARPRIEVCVNALKLCCRSSHATQSGMKSHCAG